ncbi:unnamed protein product [Rotaria socialis]|uniref:Questin oxidase family protein n=1 Tax=Rotaria socialis TaxID=392032 RepID=A0A820RSV3_9BILA|nr:unnamed protein product [Rotaria socialis]CAF3376783.1 unnamed protein product [Rotaria socialis]CAF3443693.1 unnamed protein product [Rotaria socialis]CAF3640284.1 unnamed protein product [Rotaria socialis]CAF4441008.1 unnamed protein product [Rotaria socialis]
MSRTVLDKLLTDSYARYQVLDHRGFHTHTAHHLASLRCLGASDERLEQLAKIMCEENAPYEPSPHEITSANWRQSLGDERFCKAYRDFFDQQLKTSGDKWCEKFLELLNDHKPEPLINSLVSGLAHPLIHVGYALELNSREVASEALTLSAVGYNYHHEIIDKLKAPKAGSKSFQEIFNNLRADDRLPLFDAPGVGNLEATVKESVDIVLSYFDQWQINTNNLEKTIEDLFDFSVYLYGATHKPDQIDFDFFLLHLLTSMHAIRMIYVHLNEQQLPENILWQFFYIANMIYISQCRPKIDKGLIDNYKIDAGVKTWDYVIEKTVNTKLAEDAHLVKVIRTLRDAETVYGPKDGLYLKTAVKTVDNANIDNIWIGGPVNPRQLNILKRQ